MLEELGIIPRTYFDNICKPGWPLATHPDYTAGYFMAAQTLASATRVDEAKKMLVEGISSARRTGNTHAQSEMTAMLDELK